MYLLLFLTGFIGFVAMAILGFGHGGGHHGGHVGHGHASLGGADHALGHGHHIAGAHAHAGANHGAAHDTSSQAGHHDGQQLTKSEADGGPLTAIRGFRPWSLLSPLSLFSLALGGGATGLLLKPFLSANALVFAAIAGALFFNYGVLTPIMNLVMKFVSRPSDGLEGAVAQSAEAITRFDDTGRGLVRLTLDGQNIQILAHLDSTEVEHGTRVMKGDQVLIIEVDPHRNTCRVTKELAG